MEKLIEFSTAVHGFHYYKKYSKSSSKWVFGLRIWEGKCLGLLRNKDLPKRWKDCWSSSNGNLLINQISTWPRSTNHCDASCYVVLRILLVQGVLEIPRLVKVYMTRTVKNKHHLDVRENDWGVIPREGRLTCNRKYFELRNYQASWHQTKSDEKNT